MKLLGAIGPTEIFLASSVTILIPIILIVIILIIINKWVNKSIEVKKEQNDLLKEVVKALEKKSNS